MVLRAAAFGIISALMILSTPVTSSAEETVVLSSAGEYLLPEKCALETGYVLTPCLSYILGVADTLSFQGNICNNSVSAATAATAGVVRKYFTDHPEKWGVHPAFLINTALVQAFPCQHPNRGQRAKP